MIFFTKNPNLKCNILGGGGGVMGVCVWGGGSVASETTLVW